MPPSNPNLIISVIGMQFYQPIADLISKLVGRPYQRPDRVGSNYYEGGYAAAIILLLVAAVESLIQRDRYFYRIAKLSPKPSNVASDYSKSVLCYRRHRHLEELFEVRNSIAHNHLWEIEFTTSSEGGRQHRQSQVVQVRIVFVRFRRKPLAPHEQSTSASICSRTALIGLMSRRRWPLACISSRIYRVTASVRSD